MQYLVSGQDILFNLAGQVSHIDSMTDPMTDLEINCKSQLAILEACRKVNPEIPSSTPARARSAESPCAFQRTRITPFTLPTSTDQQSERGDVPPIYGEVYGLQRRLFASPTPMDRAALSTTARIRGMVHPPRGAGRRDLLYGDGEQKRDFNYVDDVVEAFLSAGANDELRGEVFNLGRRLSTFRGSRDLYEVRGRSRVSAGSFRKSAAVSTSGTSTRTMERSGERSLGASRGSPRGAGARSSSTVKHPPLCL
jgi:UDP-glucose 4-epimerase